MRNDGVVNNGARPASSLISDAGTGSVASPSIGGNPFHRRRHKAPPMLSYQRLFLPYPQIARSAADPGSRQPGPCQGCWHQGSLTGYVRRLRRGGHHEGVRRVVILGRGGAGKPALARQLSDVTGIPAVELDALFWQPGPTPADPSRWAACQHELVQRSCWILDGDLGPYDTALQVRLRAADTIVVLDFTFLRCAWRTLRRGREQAQYWRWVRVYRRRSLPDVMRAISSEAPHAKLYVLRNPAMVQRFADEARQTAAQQHRSG